MNIAHQSFNHLKDLLINAPLLKYPDFSKPFVLITDPSNVALGAVLSQGTPPTDHPIAYASRTLNDTEPNYATDNRKGSFRYCMRFQIFQIAPFRYKISDVYLPQITSLFGSST